MGEYASMLDFLSSGRKDLESILQAYGNDDG